LLGVPLIQRVILSAKKAGIDDFIIVIGFDGEKIKKELGSGEKFGVKLTYVKNDDWEVGNGLSVYKARHLIEDDFILLMSDHIFDYRILKELIRYNTNSDVVLAVDTREPTQEDTKVFQENGKIIDIGKNIGKANCIDTGIFKCSPNIFSYIEEAIKEKKTELSEAIAKISKKGQAEVFDITKIETYDSAMRKTISPWWVDVDTEEDYKNAKKLIIQSASKNPSDFLASYIHKPIENFLVGIISSFKVTPNQITILVNILAYLAAGLFYFGYLLPASIITFIVGITDGLDGKLARVKLQTSKIGSMEHSFDLLFEFSWFIALSLYLFRVEGSSVALILCTLIVLFVSFYRHVYDQFRRASGRSLDDSGRFERIFKKIAGRRNLYNIPILICILLGVPLISLYIIAAHAGLTAIVYASRALYHLYKLDFEKGRGISS
ncbi:MAG: sugar phosphate nucleotidyltransferase, partial [Candidatus Heimdallarchaeaceae archaeon]